MKNRKRIKAFLLTVLLGNLISLNIFAAKTEIQSSPYELYSNVEQSLTSMLPELKEQLEALSKNIKNSSQSFKSIKTNLSKLEAISKKIQSEENFKQIHASIEKIKSLTDHANQLTKENKIAEAKRELNKSILYTKILLKSPVIKMSEAQIDLDQANQRIEKKDYIAAGLFLEKSLSDLNEIKMDDPKLEQQIQKIKKDILITHRQIMLGKYKDNLATKSVWKRMRQTQVDSFSHYYDLWSRNSRVEN